MTREEAKPRLSDPFLCFILIIIEQFTISSAIEVCHVFWIQVCATYNLIGELKAVFIRVNSSNKINFTGGIDSGENDMR